MEIKFKVYYRDGSEKIEEFAREVNYIPDMFKYNDHWWKKQESILDFDTGEEDKVHYTQMIK